MLIIPTHFMHVTYNAAHYPGASNTNGLEGGANCQQFAYELLRHHGLAIPDFRSRELWLDDGFTTVAQSLQPLDLLLWNKHEDAYGAHVGVYIGDGEAVHLSKEIGYPVLTPVDDFLNNTLYRVFIGAKRVKQQP